MWLMMRGASRVSLELAEPKKVRKGVSEEWGPRTLDVFNK